MSGGQPTSQSEGSPTGFEPLISLIAGMIHSGVSNYVIPGLYSHLVGAAEGKGTIRMFYNTRDHQEPITPHSHRFDFQCLVLEGHVWNRRWREMEDQADPLNLGDLYFPQRSCYLGEIGRYRKFTDGAPKRYLYEDSNHRAGEWYSMTHDQVHSIRFSKGAKVLFFEGAQKTDITYSLLPSVDGLVIDTSKVEEWMFVGAT